MRKEQEKENVLDKAAELFDLPGDIVAGMARVTVTGGQRVFIENHKGILEYGPEEVVVHGGRVFLHITGTNLHVCSMNRRELLVCGKVSGISLTEQERPCRKR